MSFPLITQNLIYGSAHHVKLGKGIGADYFAVYVELFAPFDGVVTIPYYWTFNRGSGGMWLRLTRPNGDVIEFAHLSKRIKTGPVKRGELIGITGNSGRKTSGPHLHIQIFKGGKRVPPENYPWDIVEKQLIDRVNEAFRKVFKRNPTAEESTSWQKRIKDFDSFDGSVVPPHKSLVNTMRYKKSKGSTLG